MKKLILFAAVFLFMGNFAHADKCFSSYLPKSSFSTNGGGRCDRSLFPGFLLIDAAEMACETKGAYLVAFDLGKPCSEDEFGFPLYPVVLFECCKARSQDSPDERI